MLRRRLRPLAVLPLLVASGCGPGAGPTPHADQAWVRLAAAPGRPAAAYLSLHGGTEPARLVAVEAAAAGSSELHETLRRTDDDTGGATVMTMDRIDGIDVPARTEVDLAPEGYHVMLFGMSARVKPGDRLPLTLRFAKGTPITVRARVIGAGDPAPY